MTRHQLCRVDTTQLVSCHKDVISFKINNLLSFSILLYGEPGGFPLPALRLAPPSKRKKRKRHRLTAQKCPYGANFDFYAQGSNLRFTLRSLLGSILFKKKKRHRLTAQECAYGAILIPLPVPLRGSHSPPCGSRAWV
jgi:hypothetical protein